jgi:hypothetical protein
LISYENIFIIISLNLDFFRKNTYHSDEVQEFPIEKFINLKPIKFTQDYKPIIKRYFNNVPEDVLNAVNRLLKTKIDFSVLSIRELEK